MKHKFLSLVAATCMLGFMVASANALEPMTNASLSTVSAKGVNVSNYSYVSLAGSQNYASGIVIADLSSSAVNNQANYSSYAKNFLLQLNHGKAINKVKSEGEVSQASSVSLNNSENYASGLMIVNASSSAANNQLNIAWNASSLAQINMGKAINIISGGTCTENCKDQSVSASSGVALTNSEVGANGLMIANMSSSAVNTQLNVSYGATGCFTPQINGGLAVNVISGNSGQ